MSKKQARQAKRLAKEARDVRRAGRAALLAFGTLMVIGAMGALFILRSHGAGHSHGHSGGTVAPEDEVVIDLQNPRCPACGQPTDSTATVTWHHLRIRLDQPACEVTFAKARESELDACCPEWRAAASAARTVNHATGPNKDRALAAARATWHVVLPGQRNAE